MNKENLKKITALLVHVAKVDEIYTDKERAIIKNLIISFSYTEEDCEIILQEAEKIESDSIQLFNFTSAVKKVSLEVVTDYQKITLSKDATGTVNKYELVAQVIFTIVPSGQELVFKQRKIMENTNNKSDEKDFENSTKKTFANIITNELILQLVTIQWL